MYEQDNLQTDPLKNSTIDDLLADPFGTQSQPQANSIHESLQDATILSQKNFTSEKLIERLPEHRKEQAHNLAKQIDETNSQAIIAYGSNAQKKLSEFSHSMLNEIRIKDTGEIGDTLTGLMKHLEDNRPEDLQGNQNFIQRIFNRGKRSITEIQLQYQQLGAQLDKVSIRLEREKDQLLNDNLMLEQFYEKNKDYFEALNVYISAAEVKMEELQTETIPEAIETAKASQSQMDVQKVNDLNQFLDRLDKRTHDLRLTRQMTIQQAPQIRMIQNTNQALAEKIQVSVHTAIPLWENQIMIALSLLRQEKAATTQKAVTDTTNDLLLKNSEMLKQGSLDVAREAERGIIDIETLKQTQNNLLTTLQETMDIQAEGRAQRRQAEIELSQMEDELRDTLLEIANEQKAQQMRESE